MNLKKIFLILSSLIIIVGLFITLISRDYTADNEYAKFFTDIETKIDSVQKIEIETLENAVYLLNNNGKWEIPGYENFPASEEKIKKFLMSKVFSAAIILSNDATSFHNWYSICSTISCGSGSW